MVNVAMGKSWRGDERRNKKDRDNWKKSREKRKNNRRIIVKKDGK